VGAILVDEWLPDSADVIAVRDDASISEVRAEVRRVGAAAGLEHPAIESVATAASELGRNQIVHGRQGRMAVRQVERVGVLGVEILAADGGPGIADPAAAVRGEARGGGLASGGLKIGLSSVGRLCDEIDADVRWGDGTFIAARKFAGLVPRSEVAILGRPYPGERDSGDHATFVRTPTSLLLAVVDGLGHGSPAREAAVLAIATLREHSDRELPALLEACDGALVGTRGVAASAVRVAWAREIAHAGVGNVGTHLHGQGATRFVSTNGVLGIRQAIPRIRVERAVHAPGQVLVMFTDGITTRLDLTLEPGLLGEPPLVIAHHVLARYARETDDALVLVAR
jgi:anti-sigma regulatory factor (Ser/Thr protein kinase)